MSFFVLIQYLIGAILSKKFCQKKRRWGWGGEKKIKRGWPYRWIFFAFNFSTLIFSDFFVYGILTIETEVMYLDVNLEPPFCKGNSFHVKYFQGSMLKNTFRLTWRFILYLPIKFIQKKKECTVFNKHILKRCVT